MAIRVTIDNRPNEHWQDTRLDRDIDLDALKLRLALEGIECLYPSHGDLICIRHPERGETHFNSWVTVSDHCDEGWKRTYWGPVSRGLASVNTH